LRERERERERERDDEEEELLRLELLRLAERAIGAAGRPRAEEEGRREGEHCGPPR
jgi:hypothetical protein